MSETKMLAIAIGSTLAMSVIAAGALHLIGGGPLAIVIGGTLAGAAAYIAVCLRCLPRLSKRVLEPIEDRDNFV